MFSHAEPVLNTKIESCSKQALDLNPQPLGQESSTHTVRAIVLHTKITKIIDTCQKNNGNQGLCVVK